jgi:class 3 adenylate cyclase
MIVAVVGAIVVFCDLVGSAALSTHLDPEDMWRVVASYQGAIGAVIGRYQGMIASALKITPPSAPR